MSMLCALLICPPYSEYPAGIKYLAHRPESSTEEISLNQEKQQLKAVLILQAEVLAREQGAEDRLHLRKVLLQHPEPDSSDLSHITG